jgi:hypothetical protein
MDEDTSAYDRESFAPTMIGQAAIFGSDSVSVQWSTCPVLDMCRQVGVTSSR